MRKLATACVFLSFVSTGCGGGGAAPEHSWTQPGVLRVAMVQEPKNLNPLLAGTTDDIFISRLMFEPLVSADPKGDPVPMLAEQVPTQENGGISRDGLTITYHLRKDAKWSDGVPVTSEDVKWSWQALLNPKNDVISRHGYDMVSSIDTPDPATAVVHLKSRFAPFVNTFFAESDQPYDVAPAHVLSKYAVINQAPFNSEPNVTDGPFKFATWTHGSGIVVQANPDFFQGKPALDKIEISFVPDENQSIDLLRTHKIDYVYEASISTYPAFKALADTNLVWVNVNGYEALEFNVRRVSDPLVRRAIAAALDKPAIVAALTHGQGKVATEDIPDWLWAFDPSVKSEPFDLANARKLMQQAGYTFGSDGTASKNGQPLVLLLSTDDANATHKAESLLVRDALKKLGIGVEVRYYTQAQLYESPQLGGILQGGKFDMALPPWTSGVDPDDSSQLMCDMMPPAGYNSAHYCSAEMDAAQHQALTRYDQAMRKLAYSKIQHLLARDNPYVYFWWERNLQAISVDFKGFTPNPVVESWNAWQWSI